LNLNKGKVQKPEKRHNEELRCLYLSLHIVNIIMSTTVVCGIYVYVRNINTEHMFLVGRTEDKEYYLRFQMR